MANLFALIVLLCWVPVSAAIFMRLSAARALSVSYVAGWLLLPYIDYELPGIPNFSKATAILLGCCLGLLLHKDASRLLGAFRWSWIDLPAILLCVGAIVTSLVNGLGIWDGVSASFGFSCIWAGPYLLARLVYRSIEDLRDLAVIIFLGGLCYVPLCLLEIRLSPQLCNWVYGFSPRGWGGTRFGGFRPSVFLECGLELGLWMTASCLVGFVLWYQGRFQKLVGMPVSLLLFSLFLTTVLCRSTGALALLIMGFGCWMVGRHFRTSIPVTVLVLSVVAYLIVRSTGIYDGADVVEFTQQYVDEDRAGSLEFRLDNEDLLRTKAFQRLWFGWGGWGGARVYDQEGNDISVTDGRWIIILGNLGLVGLVGTYGTLVFPCLVAIRRYGGQLCCSQEAAPVAALVVIAALFAFDSLLNNFANPIYLLSAGAVGSIALLAPGTTFREAVELVPTKPWWTRQRHSWPPPARQRSANPKG